MSRDHHWMRCVGLESEGYHWWNRSREWDWSTSTVSGLDWGVTPKQPEHETIFDGLLDITVQEGDDKRDETKEKTNISATHNSSPFPKQPWRTIMHMTPMRTFTIEH